MAQPLGVTSEDRGFRNKNGDKSMYDDSVISELYAFILTYSGSCRLLHAVVVA